MSSLKALCHNLEKCTLKIEEEIKISLNDIQNLVTSNKSTDVRISLEKAKDYHYKEIMNVLADIVNKIKIILFHDEKIRYLSDKQNFSQQELNRYSYVQRQVNAFSRSTPDLTTSSTDEGPLKITKREKRRVASEISVESLDAWEKYLDQKPKEEPVEEKSKVEPEKISENLLPVKRNNISSARRRKKFVSSTLDGFLEGNKLGRSLESIIEDTNASETYEEANNSVNGDNFEENGYSDIEQIGSLEDVAHYEGGIDDNTSCRDTDVSDKETEDSISRLAVLSVQDGARVKDEVVSVKPRIIDVIYKKKPT